MYNFVIAHYFISMLKRDGLNYRVLVFSSSPTRERERERERERKRERKNDMWDTREWLLQECIMRMYECEVL